MGNIKTVLAKNMKAARERLGYSQSKLAELAGVSVPFIGEIEIARKSPSLENVQNIAEALDMQVYQLFVEEEQREVMSKQKTFAALRKELQEKVLADIDATIRRFQRT